jgi:hypothetical protein
MNPLLHENGQTLVSLACWYKGQLHSKATGTIDPTGKLKREILTNKINEINAQLKKHGMLPVKLKSAKK